MGWGGGGRGLVAGGAKGKGGGKTPWSFYRVLDGLDSLSLLSLSKKIPDSWVDWKHGGKRQVERLHSTVILNMTGPQHLERLRRIAAATPPAQVTIRELFCSRVDRIRDAEVYCIGAALASPSIRALKDAFVAEEPDEEMRRRHVPYDTEGHISLAYILSGCKRQAEQFVREQQEELTSQGLSVDSIIFEDERGQETTIALEGDQEGSAVAAEPEPKRARLSGPVEIDGSILEGGGQILRMSGAYSALFGVPVHITKIRAGRSKPGLAAQHLESLRLVRDVSGGTLRNDQLGSCEVFIQPGPLSPGSFTADPGTAGAVTLMVQAALFPLLFTGGDCYCDLRGGTDVSFSPPLGFLQRVLHPTLSRMGAQFEVKCPTRGFFPRGGGAVQLTVSKLKGKLKPIDISERGEPVQAQAVLHATRALGAEEQASLKAVQSCASSLAQEASAEFSLGAMPKSDFKHRYWVDMVVRTSTGALFHGSSEPKELKAQPGGLARLFEAAAREAVAPLSKQLSSGAAVDEHLLDQLILPASLAAGTSRLLAAEPSLHAQTAIHIAELLVPGVSFNTVKQGPLSLIEVSGIGHSPGPVQAAAPAPARSSAPFQLPKIQPKPAAPKAFATVATPPARQPPARPPVQVAPAAAPVAQRWKPRAAVGGAQEALQLQTGSLSCAAPQMLADLRNDLQQLSEEGGVEATASVQEDMILLRGGDEQRRNVVSDLRQLLEFYFGKDGVLAAA